MHRLVGIAVTLLALWPAAAPRLAPLVSASTHVETTVPLALVNPHYPTSVDDEASALADDVNAERAKHGLAPLRRTVALDRFAQAKAVEMAARGYFGHTDPDGVTFQDRMRAWHWPTAYVAENIAFDRDEPHAHAAFVNSPPHYANVIDPRERRFGVAVVTVGEGETFYVEDFSGE
jgi:uncharacterized protein YkwD